MKVKFKKLTCKSVITILLIIILAVCAETKFSFQASLQKIVLTITASCGVSMFFLTKSNILNRKTIRTLFDAWIPFGIACIYSIVILLVQNEYGLPIIGQAITTTIYAIVQMMFVYALYHFYKEKAIDIVFYYICLSYLISIFFALREASISMIISNYNSIYNVLERHDVGTAVVPIILLYLFKIYFQKEKTKKYKHRIAISLLILILCGKRSAFVAILMGIIVLFIANTRIKNKAKVFNLISVATVAFLFLYVVLIHSGLLELICLKLGISTAGRIYVWSWFSNMYSISPLYFGKGLQFVHKYMQAGIAEGGDVTSMVSNFGFLHNSDLQIYIELGFWGFFFWFFYFLYFIPNKMMVRFGKDSYYLACILMISMVFLFMTDNVMTYPVFQTTTYTALLLLAFERTKKAENSV